MHPTAVINVVGLTGSMLGEDTPHLSALARNGAASPLTTVTPAVTCTAQSSFLTGSLPRDHGIVGNGWYSRDDAEVRFWKQSNRLVQGEKVWEAGRNRDSEFTSAKMFWWYNMYSTADWSVTPRPIYPADGRKVVDIYSNPADLSERLTAEIGAFPFFNFWGPKADIRASEWIAEAGWKIAEWQEPTLNLIYIPHLDYNLQRLGPYDPAIRADLRAVDQVCGRLIDRLANRGTRIIVLSEYGITPVLGAVHINRVLREAGHIQVRTELGLEMLDAGASSAFAVSDHQVAHVYVSEPGMLAPVEKLLESVPGIERVLGRHEQAEIGLDHERSGDLVAISSPDRWFTYYYWLNDDVAPDYARTVDIHRKPGYDPVELFIDPKLVAPGLRVARNVLKKKLGFRYLMDVISLDASLVRGSHGRLTDRDADGPVFISSQPDVIENDTVHATQVKDLILKHVFE
jgi:predicted AlkP superfamily pyrophosphatase or phosphodiesterase